jgi:hypothetical protein
MDFAETDLTESMFAESMFAESPFAETMPILLKLSIILGTNYLEEQLLSIAMYHACTDIIILLAILCHHGGAPSFCCQILSVGPQACWFLRAVQPANLCCNQS